MRTKSIVWIPVLLVGAMVYWTLALGFGGLSLFSLTMDFPLSDADAAHDSYQSITVNLSEAPEQQVGGDPAGPSGVTVDLVQESDIPRPPRADQGGSGLAGGSTRTGPGDTAF